MSNITLLGLSGALRRASANRQLIREAARLFGTADLTEADLNLPLYDGDLEEGEGIPEAVQHLAAQIAQADAVVISTPEYNKGPSGVLKNALDWVSRTSGTPWADKPVAVMSAAAGRAGGERAQMVLRSFLVPFQSRLLSGPELHLADCRNQFDAEGRLISAPYTKTLQVLMDKLRVEVTR
ncbi:NADPH-dependent FMN reductase [Antarcticimicrobium sediminis]|uniref:NADPH-dependent oxidoreductase n=1 Tax=Antarcticimicrobium sediminis TaxID=2546227 RepID=A0A4V2Z851_9RHOB|nr:NAD(P)H-dependent oxidoreductase [Antarcticimicrobium sediminis]TDE38996.1 NADPH-dependent oxidoreductase [Antarcticimicrobium sediminis]